MALTRTTATGRGKTSYRVSFEGLHVEFVTNQAMVTTDAVGRLRATGLQREGLIIEDRIDIIKAKLDAQGMTLSIGELPWLRYATQAFAYRPSIVTYLTADLTAASTTLTVLSTTGMLANDVIHIGRESIKIGTVASGTSLTGCTRAYRNNGVPAFAHYTADGANYRRPQVTNRPDSVEGRRVFVYMYDETTSPTGDGTLVWMGICSSDAQEAGRGLWRVTVDPISRLLQQDLGGDLEEPVHPRGIYYPPQAAFELVITPRTGANYDSTLGTRTVLRIAGEFFETQEAFVTAVNAKIAGSAVSAYGVVAHAAGDAGWYLTVTPTAAGGGPFYVDVSTMYGAGLDETHGGITAGVRALYDIGTDGPGSVSGAGVNTVAAATTYAVPHTTAATIPGAGQVPRGAWGLPRDAWTPPRADMDHDPTDGESLRLHLGDSGFVPSSTTTAVQIDWGSGAEEVGRVTNYSSTEMWVEASAGTIWGVRRFTPANLPGIKAGRRFGSLAGIDFGELLTLVVAAAPDGAELGITPELTTVDIDTTTSAANIAASHGGARWLARRLYAQFGSKRCEDVFSAEAQLTSVIPTLGADGRIVYRAFRQPSASSATASIAAADVLVDGGFPAWERNAFGSINVITLKRGYNALTDDYDFSDVHTRDVAAFSRNKLPRPLEIKPLSRGWGESAGGAPTPDQLLDAMTPLLGVFARGYEIVTVAVPFTLFRPDGASTGVLCGDTVSLTCSTLPNSGTGLRGVTDAPCLVIGRRWDLGSGIGQLTLLMTTQGVTGYAPVVMSASQLDLGGNLWEITVQFTHPSGSGSYTGDDVIAPTMDLADFFVVGDKVRVREYDSDAPTSQTGTVTTVAFPTIEVQFDGVWVPATDNVIGYNGAASGPSTTQRDFAYIADTDGRIAFTSGSESARQVA